MKISVLIALICLLVSGLMAAEAQSNTGMFKSVPRIYTQLLVNDIDGGELPNVIGRSSEDYQFSAFVTTRPGEIMSTDSTLATVPSPNPYIRIFRLGNGTSFPFVTCSWLQLAGFTTPWATGDTVRFNLKHIPSGESTTWEIVIPDASTDAIGYKQKYDPIAQVIAPPWRKEKN